MITKIATAYNAAHPRMGSEPRGCPTPGACSAGNEIERLRSAITGLLRFHQEGDDGAELPREYWSPGYREAVEIAEALVGSNG